MRTSTPPRSKKVQFSHKVIIAVGAFCLGLVLPLIGVYLLPSSEDAKNTIDDSASELDSTQGEVLETFIYAGFTWVGRLTKEEDPRAYTYELVRVDAAGNEMIVFTHPRGFDSTEWASAIAVDPREQKLTFTYKASPGEAFIKDTIIHFDENGEEALRVVHKNPSGTLTIQEPGTPMYTVLLATSETCSAEGASGYESGVWQGPGQTTIFGVKVISENGTTQTFELPESHTVDCGVGYGDQIIEPLINDLQTSPYGAAFELPTGDRASVGFEGILKTIKVRFY